MSEKQKFINQNLALNGEPQIIKFIADFVYFDDQDVHNRFKNGYCYYFTKMLQTAFPGGYIAWAVPFGHLVYMYNQVPYDIEVMMTLTIIIAIIMILISLGNY